MSMITTPAVVLGRNHPRFGEIYRRDGLLDS